MLPPAKGDRPNARPFKERFESAAFGSALATRDVVCTWNHNPHYLLGRTAAGTLRLHNEADGLYVECDRLDTTYANDLQKLIERGDISGMSFQFVTVADVVGRADKWDEVTIKQAHLVETSFVSNPCYPASAAGVRSDDDLAAAYLQAATYRVDPAHLLLLKNLSEM